MGDLLNGVPRSSKETWIIVFLPFSHPNSLPFLYLFKWVCGSEWVCGFVKIDNKWVCGFAKIDKIGFVDLSGFVFLSKKFVNFWQLAIFDFKNGNPFSLEFQ